ncbi:hypothetical protein [Streptomyces sp. NPDC058620]|uniref:hypothetical protein n=1 Tax=Streptomyces sp. NPDC058620 TaxID=3346560 RepID=UPI003662D743
MSVLNTVLPQHEAGLLVTARLWPLLAARMQRMTMDGAPLGAHLARLQPADAAWRQGPPAETTGRLLLATHHALTTPPGEPLPIKPHVSPTAARSRSTTAPTAPTGSQAPSEPAVPAHRQQAVPAKSTSRHRA